MNMPICLIPFADYKTIYNIADVERAMESSCSRRNEALQVFYEAMKKSGGVRFIVKPSSTNGLDGLYESSPNFGSVKIALSIYHDILEQHSWVFDAEPSNDVLDCLAEVAPRDMCKALIDAFGNTRLDKRDHLLPEDLNNRKISSGKKA